MLTFIAVSLDSAPREIVAIYKYDGKEKHVVVPDSSVSK